MVIEPGHLIGLAGVGLTIGTVIVSSVRVVGHTERATAVLQAQHDAIKESIDKLTERVGEQNGRIGKVEVEVAVLRERDR